MAASVIFAKDPTGDTRKLQCDENGRLVVVGATSSQKRVLIAGGNNGDQSSYEGDLMPGWSSSSNVGFSFPTSAVAIKIVSTSVQDASGGTGVRTLRVYGIDGDWNEATEDVTMNGTTVVTLSGTYRRINRLLPLTAGANMLNQGRIRAYYTDGSDINLYEIDDEQRIHFNAVTVPNGYEGVIKRLAVTTGGVAGQRVIARVYNEAGVPTNVFSSYTGAANNGLVFTLDLPIEAKNTVLLVGGHNSDGWIEGSIMVEIYPLNSQ